MPGQKRKYTVRFSPGRIKKIMQKNTEVGRIARAVPVIISRAMEIFLKSLLTKTCLITESKFSSVVSVDHMKQCIESEKLFHFLKDLPEGAASPKRQKDRKGMNMWPLYRKKRLQVPVKKVSDAEEKTAKKKLCKPERNTSSSSDSSVSCTRQQNPEHAQFC